MSAKRPARRKNLRDIILEDLKHLNDMEAISFDGKASNNKDLLIEMMKEFQKYFPGMAYYAMDEWLDYLRGRKDQQLV